jgi:hypothetical protein
MSTSATSQEARFIADALAALACAPIAAYALVNSAFAVSLSVAASIPNDFTQSSKLMAFAPLIRAARAAIETLVVSSAPRGPNAIP